MPDATPSLENLYAMQDDNVRKQLIIEFKNQLKASEPVRSVFFPQATCAIAPADAQFVGNVASALVCSAVAMCSLYDFHSTVDGEKCKNYWSLALTSDKGAAESRHLYDALFDDNCSADGISFRQYHNDSAQPWGQKLADYLISDTHINQIVSKLISGDKNWNAKLNLMLYKVNRLNSDAYKTVLGKFQQAISQFALQFLSCNYFNPGMLSQDAYVMEVNTAAAVEKSQWIPTPGPTASTVCGKEYGEGLWNFIKGTPKALGLATGVAPQNRGMQTCTAYGCHTSMSRALKASGTPMDAKRFSDMAPGDKLIGKNGIESSVSHESSLIKTHAPLWIYGLNDIPPFFTAETAFQTPQGGWKSLLPEVTNQINPKMEATLLQPGDEILRAISTNPLKHDSIKVTEISQALLQAGSMIARPIFTEIATYHVEGFLVALNSPVFTPDRLAESVGRLDPEEQRALYKGLRDVMPLLVKAMGSFVEAPIVAAFKNAKQIKI